MQGAAAACVVAASHGVGHGILTAHMNLHPVPHAGSWFGTERLPAVVYIHPHCMPATCGAPPVLELRTDAGSSGGGSAAGAAPQPTSTHDVATWLTRTGR